MLCDCCVRQFAFSPVTNLQFSADFCVSCKMNHPLLRLARNKTNQLNQKCQEFQDNVNSLFESNKNQAILRTEMKQLCADYSWDVNRLEMDYFAKVENYLKKLNNDNPKSKLNDKSDIISNVSSISHRIREPMENKNKNDGNNYENLNDSSDFSDNEHLFPSGPRSLIHSKKRSSPSNVEHFKEFKCSLCPKVFSNAKSLRCHVGGKHPNYRYQLNKDKVADSNQIYECKVYHDKNCNFIADTAARLYKHIRGAQHDGYPFECQYTECNQKFKWKRELKQHYLTIHNDPARASKPYFSLLDKSAVFNKHENENENETVSNDNEKYECKIYYDADCNYVTNRLGDLYIHIRVKHGGYPFECQHRECDKKFKFKKELREHYLKIHNDYKLAAMPYLLSTTPRKRKRTRDEMEMEMETETETETEQRHQQEIAKEKNDAEPVRKRQKIDRNEPEIQTEANNRNEDIDKNVEHNDNAPGFKCPYCTQS